MGLEVGQPEENPIDIFFGHKGIVGCFTRLATVSQANFLAAFPHPRGCESWPFQPHFRTENNPGRLIGQGNEKCGQSAALLISLFVL
jgi:hypothetical protein